MGKAPQPRRQGAGAREREIHLCSQRCRSPSVRELVLVGSGRARQREFASGRKDRAREARAGF